jgi:hypothetical protein
LYSFPARLLDHLRQTLGIFGEQDCAIAFSATENGYRKPAAAPS